MEDPQGFFENVKARFQDLSGLAQTEARCAAILARRQHRGPRVTALLKSAARLPERMMEVEVLLKDLEFAVHAKARR